MRRLCRQAELADPGSARFELPDHPDGYSLCVVQRDGAVHGYINSCPHTDAPMDWQPGKFLAANGDYIQCAMHGALFEIDTGRCVAGPCTGQSLRPVNVYVDGGVVVLDEDW